MDKISFIHPTGTWNNIEVKIMSHSWTDMWLKIFFHRKTFHILVQIGVVNEHHKEKKYCSSNEFFILSNLTLLLVCGLEANKRPNYIV